MTTAYLTFVATIAAAWPQLVSGQARPLSVCEALNSAADHQAVVIHAAIASTRHGTYIFEGTGREPCPGWPKRFFTAPSSIPIFVGPYPGLRVPDHLLRDYRPFGEHLRILQSANLSALHMVTISGVIIRKLGRLSFRSADGSYFGWGEGLDGGSAAMLVMTSVPIEDR